MFLNKLISNRYVVAIISFLLVTATFTTVFATPPLSKKIKSQNNTLKSQKKTLENTERAYEEIQDKIDETEIKIEKIDTQIENLLDQVHILNVRINKTHTKILKEQKNLYGANLDVKKEQILYNQRMRAMYMNGFGSYIEVIFNAKDASDFLSRITTVKKIMEYDNLLIKNLKARKDNVARRKKLLENYKNIQSGYKKEIEGNLAQVRKSKIAQNTLIKDLHSQETRYAKQIKKIRAKVFATVKIIEALRKKYLQSRRTQNSHSVSMPFSSDGLLGYAANFIGTPYRWGGTTPGGFDCSGYTKYVFKKFGVNLPRTSREQAHVGSSVSRSNLKPGDLVFFGSPIHHVGIYVGNNCYIHSPRTGESVKVSPLTRKDFNTARRVK